MGIIVLSLPVWVLIFIVEKKKKTRVIVVGMKRVNG